MRPQTFQAKDANIVARFVDARRRTGPGNARLRLSWSNWGFGPEPLQLSVARLAKNKIKYIELHGNRYGPDLGYKTQEVRSIVSDAGLAVSGVCGMAAADSEFASNRPHVRQRAIDYFRRQADLCKEVGGSYVLVVPGAVGRPRPYDANEFDRAADGIRIVAEYLQQLGIKGAIEPIRPEEVSLCHTFEDARRLIDAIDCPGVQHINGDLFHMLASEDHIGETILQAGAYLVNLHMADTNRRALGNGMLNLDVVLMALYAIGYEDRAGYCTPEPLGAGGNPYAAMFETSPAGVLDELVAQTASTFFQREEAIRTATDDDLLGHGALGA